MTRKTTKWKIEEEEHRTGERYLFNVSAMDTSPRLLTVTTHLHTHTFNYKRDSISSCYFIEKNNNTLLSHLLFISHPFYRNRLWAHPYTYYTSVLQTS